MKIIDGVRYYNRKDLATMLGVSEATIANYQKKGKIKAVRISRTFWISESNLKSFLNGDTETPKGEK